jgi:hypothetical protein
MISVHCCGWRERWRVIDQNVERMPDEGTMCYPPPKLGPNFMFSKSVGAKASQFLIRESCCLPFRGNGGGLHCPGANYPGVPKLWGATMTRSIALASVKDLTK